MSESRPDREQPIIWWIIGIIVFLAVCCVSVGCLMLFGYTFFGFSITSLPSDLFSMF